MEIQSGLRPVLLELVEPQRKAEVVEVLVTSVEARLLSTIISLLKTCSQCQLPFGCGRVRKSSMASDEQVAELCICAGRELVDTVLKEMVTSDDLDKTCSEVTTILREVELMHGAPLSLVKKVLGETWPITRYPRKRVIDDVVPVNERDYVERCISMLTTHSTVVVASPSTSFLAVTDESTLKVGDTIRRQASKADMCNHPVYTAIKRAMAQAADTDEAYLLTGYDVFTLEEPCIFCSMCLLHARIRRAFYSVPMEHNGGLNESLMVPALPGVNHKFPVIRFS